MTRDQRIVAVGAASGVLFMAASVYVLSRLLPVPGAQATADRLAYALKWAVVAAAPYFVMLASVGNARFFSEAIDPTRGAEDRSMTIIGRVADNTTQQLLLLLIGSLALAVQLPAGQLQVVGAAAIVFAFMRVAFWIGYRIHPLYRAFGFAGTAYLNLGLLVASAWLALG